MRTLSAVMLVAFAMAALLPKVLAYYQGYVDLPAAEPARYTITSTSQLVTCSVPSQIRVQEGQALTHTFFRCINNYNAPVTLTWRVMGDDPFVTASGSITLSADGVAACRTATLTAGNTLETRTVVFQGVANADAAFYVELSFRGEVRVQKGAGNTGGGCP